MKRTFLLLAIALCIWRSLTAQTNVSGYILSNTTWTVANSPYIVTGNILVNNGVTLTIEPGVVVKFDTTKTLQVDGELIAIGTAQNRITFTANDATPAKGSWGRIQFSDNSTDAVFDTLGNYVSGSIFKYCDIRYGGGVPGDATVYCDTSSPYFSHCRISNCLKQAVYFTQAGGKVDSSSIRDCVGTALHFNSPIASDLIVKNDTFEFNGGGIGYGGSGSLANVTIENCLFSNSDSAISVQSTLSSIITDNVFTANTYAIRGDLGANATISNNVFTAHTSSVIGSCSPWGFISGGDVNITNNYFENNMGVISMQANTFVVIQDNTFKNNRFHSSNGSLCYSSGGSNLLNIYGHGVIINNVFEGNTSAYGGYLLQLYVQLEITGNVFKNNSPVTIDCGSKPNICSNKFLNNSGSVINSNPSYRSTGANSYIHGNEFLYNSGIGATISIVSNFPYYVNDYAIINRNEFQGDSTAGDPIISIIGCTATVSNNRFLNNPNSGYPVISVSNSNSNIHNNDFLGNTGVSCLRISGTTQPVVTQNNFVNPGVQYEIENLIPFGPGANINVSDNYWGTTNTTHIDSVIKDYFDDSNLSVALYPPVLTSPAFVDTNASCTSTVCALSVSGSVVNVSCFGGTNGSINITVSNGTSPYTYVWSSGASSNLTNGNYTVTVIDANFCSATKSFVISQPASPVAVVSAVITNANCNSGGSINIAASGGASPYTYNWGSGLTTEDRTGLNPGNYSVTVRDNYNCSVTQSFTVGQDAGPYISGLATNTSCNNSCDGAINLSITGAAPFTYDWGTGFGTTEDTSGLCAGTYNVTVADSNNCGIAASFPIASPAALSATATITASVSCSGYSDGAATAATTGGTPPYSFLWSDGQTADTATSLSAGVYAVTVTDSLGCTAVASVTVADGNNVFAGAIGGPTAASINQTATYIVSANVNYSYSWSVLNGAILSGHGSNSIEVAWTVAGTGLVELIASEQGCADTVSKSVTVVDTTQNCSALFYLYPDTIPHSYFAVNTASGIAPLYYSWNWGDGSANDTAAYPSHTYTAAGFYTICLSISDSSGCSDTYCNPYFLLKSEDESSAMIHVNVVAPTFTSLHGTVQENFTLYPNPTTGTVTLKGSNIRGSAVCTLLDAMGKQLIRKYFANGVLAAGVPLDLSALHAGLYFLKIQTGNGSRILKVVKE